MLLLLSLLLQTASLPAAGCSTAALHVRWDRSRKKSLRVPCLVSVKRT